MSLLVVSPGVSSTIQDLGRRRSRALGVPVGGAFDQWSSAIANSLVGNPQDCATLEFTYVGGTYEADDVTALALAGAPMSAKLRQKRGREGVLEFPVAFTMEPGDRLILGGTSLGARTYLAVRGGWLTPKILESRSTEITLGAGDSLACASARTPRRRLPAELSEIPGASPAIRVMDGPEAHVADSSWLDRAYRVDPRSDRMGIRLEGTPCIVRKDDERLSTPVCPGTIQMAGGLPIILGVACGTLGGYPHIGQVIAADLPRLAQVRPSEQIRFQRVTTAEARRLHRDWLDRLRVRSLVIRVLASEGIVEGQMQEPS